MKIDKDAVFLYSENARGKIKEIAMRLKKSSQRVKYSLAVLEKEKVVYNPYCIFDYSHLGLILFRVYFKGGYIGDNDTKAIRNTLNNNPYLLSMYELSGEFDLVLEIAVPNPSRFNKELRKMTSQIPSLNTYKILLNVVTHIYPRSYLSKNLLGKNQEPSIIIGGDREIENFSPKEMAVLKHLLDKPTQRLTTLSEQVNLNIKTIIITLHELQHRKTIRGFRFIIDHNQLGINKFRLFLKLHNYTEEGENQLMSYLLKTKEIVQVNKTVGDWNMEVDLETPDKVRMRLVVSEIRENFKDLIETFNIMEFYRYYKKSYLPTYLFEQA